MRADAPPVALRDATRLFARRLDGPKRAPPLESAIESLLKAASSDGKREDVEAATDQVTVVLRQSRRM